ncbi:BPSS1780 family membrane protein [Ideonella sp.]|uniref:BPSS1780 family membrane protein n=1 Tax=Ideonella sp. TaxID=1929293 RepID=UPI0035B03784
MGLKLQEVSSAAGWRWVLQAFAEYGRYPFGYTGLFLAFLVAVFVAMLLPLLGGLLLLMSMPLLTLGFMMATEAAQRGVPPAAAVYPAAWRGRPADRRRALLALLMAFAVASTAALWVSETVDGGAFSAWLEAFIRGTAPADEVSKLAMAPGATSGAIWRIALTAAVAVPFWFAPALVHWAGQGPAQALFSSTVALWRARGAFLVYFFAWTMLGLGGMLLGSVLIALAGPSLAAMLMLPLALMLTAVFYVSLYFSFRDCFGDPASA